MARKVVKIIHSHTEFEPVCELIEMAISRYGVFQDEYLHAIVRDAKRLSSDECTIYTVERSVVKYSSCLSSLSKRELALLDPDDLSLDQLQTLLRFLEEDEKRVTYNRDSKITQLAGYDGGFFLPNCRFECSA